MTVLAAYGASSPGAAAGAIVAIPASEASAVARPAQLEDQLAGH